MNGCQIITTKRGNSSNSLDFKEVYSLYRFTETIRKKLKLDAEKMPYSMLHFGNTSSASIPLTIVTQLKGKIEDKPTKIIGCAFGVGLSWGTVAFETEHLLISELVEV